MHPPDTPADVFILVYENTHTPLAHSCLLLIVFNLVLSKLMEILAFFGENILFLLCYCKTIYF